MACGKCSRKDKFRSSGEAFYSMKVMLWWWRQRPNNKSLYNVTADQQLIETNKLCSESAVFFFARWQRAHWLKLYAGAGRHFQTEIDIKKMKLINHLSKLGQHFRHPASTKSPFAFAFCDWGRMCVRQLFLRIMHVPDSRMERKKLKSFPSSALCTRWLIAFDWKILSMTAKMAGAHLQEYILVTCVL